MKRLVLAAILIFPVLSLVAWLMWGITRPNELPKATEAATNSAAIVTNTMGSQPSGSSANNHKE